jgi:hypothetical protein
MPRALSLALAVSAAFAASAARAEFSAEWQAVADEIKAECRAFDETLPPDVGPFPKFVGDHPWPKPPRGAPARPHVCLFVRFDINAAGETENVEVVFKAPSNLVYGFIREAKLAIGKWRFEVPPEKLEGYSIMYVSIDYIPVKAWTYQLYLDLRNTDS